MKAADRAVTFLEVLVVTAIFAGLMVLFIWMEETYRRGQSHLTGRSESLDRVTMSAQKIRDELRHCQVVRVELGRLEFRYPRPDSLGHRSQVAWMGRDAEGRVQVHPPDEPPRTLGNLGTGGRLVFVQPDPDLLEVEIEALTPAQRFAPIPFRCQLTLYLPRPVL